MASLHLDTGGFPGCTQPAAIEDQIDPNLVFYQHSYEGPVVPATEESPDLQLPKVCCQLRVNDGSHGVCDRR